MKRKVTIAGIFLALAAAMVLAVLVMNHAPEQTPPRDSMTVGPDGKVVVQLPESRTTPTIVSTWPKGTRAAPTNAAAVPVPAK